MLCAQSLSHFATPWTVAHQALLVHGISRQEHWSRLPFSTTGDLLAPGFEQESLASLVLVGGSLPLRHLGSPLIDPQYTDTKRKSGSEKEKPKRGGKVSMKSSIFPNTAKMWKSFKTEETIDLATGIPGE